MTGPSLFGYEWAFTCECGQTVNLAGLQTHPVPDIKAYEECEVLRERVRSIENELQVKCPNAECDRTITISIEATSDDTE